MSPDDQRAGFAYGIAAYAFWGVMPVYWKLVADIPAVEILAHRVPWSCLAFALIARWRGQLGAVTAALADRSQRPLIAAAALLLSCNWLAFVYAIVSGQVMQASLGYFINPLVSVVLGVVFLRERLRPAQWIAVALAAAGVVQLGAGAGELPWLGLAMAATFGLYGLLRKTMRVDALPGSTAESLLVAPIACAFLVWLEARGQGHFGHSGAADALLLAGSGLLTALPLLWFASAARRLPLSTLGFLQYLAPTLQLGLAVLAYGEAFTAVHARSFACIWIALAIFSADRALAGRSA